MFRDLDILEIAGRFWVVPMTKAIVKTPFDDGRFFRIFDDIEDAQDFRRESQ